MRLASPDEVNIAGRSEFDRQALAYVRHAADTISNVTTQLRLLDTSSHLMPVSINNGGERTNNSYVVSPLTAYTGYAEYEVGQLGLPWLAAPLRPLIWSIGTWLKSACIDRIVQVNNWLLSTNLYPPDWSGADLPAVTRLLIDTYPDHAIGLRSLNRHSNTELMSRLEALGYLSIPSRQIYLFDGNHGLDAAYLRRRDSRKDARLLAQTDYIQVPGAALANNDYPRLEYLYNLLYLQKYCPLNPHFSAKWLQAGQRDGWLDLTALRSPSGRIDAVLGWVATKNILTTPVVGYDTALPQKIGLYRLISQISLEEAAYRQILFNMSAGAAHFKRMRGGVPEIEYSLVYVNHLLPQRQRVWRTLSRLMYSIGLPLVRRLQR